VELFRQFLAGLFIGGIAFVGDAHGDSYQDVINQTLKDAKVSASDSIQVKINKILHLLNDSPYLSESNPSPQFRDYAKFKATPFSKANSLLRQYGEKGSGGDIYNPYDLNSMRTPEEMISQKIGGGCQTQARVIAHLLTTLGVAPDEVRIVSTVSDDEYFHICPQGAGHPRNRAYGGSQGHAFVLLKMGTGWKLINSTYAPLVSNTPNGKHTIEIDGLKKSTRNFVSKAEYDSYQSKRDNLVSKLDTSDIEMVDFINPTELETRLNGSKLVPVPEFESLPEKVPGGIQGQTINFRKMSIFMESKSVTYPPHHLSERSNLIASGRVDSDICRFDPPMVAGHRDSTSAAGASH